MYSAAGETRKAHAVKTTILVIRKLRFFLSWSGPSDFSSSSHHFVSLSRMVRCGTGRGRGGSAWRRLLKTSPCVMTAAGCCASRSLIC